MHPEKQFRNQAVALMKRCKLDSVIIADYDSLPEEYWLLPGKVSYRKVADAAWASAKASFWTGSASKATVSAAAKAATAIRADADAARDLARGEARKTRDLFAKDAADTAFAAGDPSRDAARETFAAGDLLVEDLTAAWNPITNIIFECSFYLYMHP